MVAERTRSPRSSPRFRLWRDLGLEFDLAICDLSFVKLVGGTETRGAAQEARDIFTRLGAQPFLARLDEATARPTPQAQGLAPSQAAAIEDAEVARKA